MALTVDKNERRWCEIWVLNCTGPAIVHHEQFAQQNVEQFSKISHVFSKILSIFSREFVHTLIFYNCCSF